MSSCTVANASRRAPTPDFVFLLLRGFLLGLPQPVTGTHLSRQTSVGTTLATAVEVTPEMLQAQLLSPLLKGPLRFWVTAFAIVAYTGIKSAARTWPRLRLRESVCSLHPAAPSHRG